MNTKLTLLSFIVGAVIAMISYFNAWPLLNPSTIIIISLLFFLLPMRHAFPSACHGLSVASSINLIIIIIGYAWINLAITNNTNHLLTKTQIQNKNPIILTGTITSLPKYKYHAQQFDFTLIRTNQKLKLTWPHAHHAIIPGDTWRLKIKLTSLNNIRNYKNFNYSRYLFLHNYTGIGKVLNYHNLKIKKNSNKIFYLIPRARYFIRQTIFKTLNHKPNHGIIAALTVGDRARITEKIWQVFQATGTSHLIAISGLHIGLCAWLSYIIIYNILLLFLKTGHVTPIKITSQIIACILAFIYALLAGFSLPTQRAITMLSLYSLAIILRRQTHIWHIYLMACCLDILFNPMSIFTASFWLSYVAVAGILYGLKAQEEKQHFLITFINLQCVLTAVLLPLNIMFFHAVSPTSMIANLIAVPYVSWLMIPLCLLASLLWPFSYNLAAQIWKLAYWFLPFLWRFLSYLAHYQPQQLTHLYWSPIKIILLSIISLLCLSLQRLRWRLLAVIGLFIIVFLG